MASDGEKHDERAGRAAAELKETEDLLAGFDRPGRTPRTPPAARDFVDYHLDKGRSNPAARRAARSPDAARRDLPTAIIPGHARTMPRWLPWAAVFLVMAIGGIGVAAVITSAPTAPGSSLVGNAATLAPTLPAADPTTGPARDVPPPPPPADPIESAPNALGATETTSADAPPAPATTPAARTAPPTPRSAPAGTEAPAPADAPPAPTQPPPNGDFIRTL
ncbi:MAG: hypothetical protein KF764_25015 [Labilithrix sp.]|nr:hypothetical protein [Labilithrix sp.]